MASVQHGDMGRGAAGAAWLIPRHSSTYSVFKPSFKRVSLIRLSAILAVYYSLESSFILHQYLTGSGIRFRIFITEISAALSAYEARYFLERLL